MVKIGLSHMVNFRLSLPHSFCSGVELFFVNKNPWAFLFSGVSIFPEVGVVMFSESSFEIRGVADIEFTCGLAL